MLCRIVIFIILLLFSKSWKIGANKWTTKKNFNNYESVKRGMNNSMGHSNELWSLGLNTNLSQFSSSLNHINKDNDNNNNDDNNDDENEDNNSIIKLNEINTALKDAIALSKKSTETFIKDGWTLVEVNELFRLYKRRSPGQKMSEYLMIGEVKDVSPRKFLQAQVERVLREQWDTSMDEMKVLQTNNDIKNENSDHQEHSNKREEGKKAGAWSPNSRFLNGHSSSSTSSTSSSNDNNHINDDDGSLSSGSISATDIIYYRTKWPWPLKNRDYVLARRCKQIVSASSGLPPALVFVSKSFAGDTNEEIQTSTDNNNNNKIDLEKLKEKIPFSDGAIRVDQYWCHSTFMSTQTSKLQEALNAMNIDDTPTQNHESSSHHDTKHPARHFRRKHNNQSNSDGDVDEHWKPASPITVLGQVLDEPGTCFVTRFCDECRVPLPQYMIDIIAKHAEKEVRGSIQRLHMAAKDMH